MNGSDPAVAATQATRRSGVEAAIVLGLPTALFIVGSIWAVSLTDRPAIELSDARILRTLLIEAVLAGAFLPWLRRRAWTPQRVSGAPVPSDVLRGLAVWVGAVAAVYGVLLLVYWTAPEWASALAARRFPGTLSPLVVVLTSVWNPIFEEFLWLGYGISALESRYGLTAACVVSLGLRLAVHLYQGPTAVLITLLPATLVFTLYYARTRRLWPVVVAHVIADAIGLSAYAGEA